MGATRSLLRVPFKRRAAACWTLDDLHLIVICSVKERHLLTTVLPSSGSRPFVIVYREAHQRL